MIEQEKNKCNNNDINLKNMSQNNIINVAKNVIETEIEALCDLKKSINGTFDDIINLLFVLKGKVVISGIGKSGLIARKIAATMSSTGTATLFVHPTECLHGDFGLVNDHDLAILMSYSGETKELLDLVSIFKRRGIKIIAITGNIKSNLAKYSDFVLNVCVKKEACPMNMVPTSSSTAMLALGDAIAVSLLVKKGFSKNDFARLHPGGNLGTKMLTKVKDIMHKGDSIPLISKNEIMKKALIEMTSKSLGVTGVVDEQDKLIGTITDGDLRRHLDSCEDFLNQKVENVMSTSPKVIMQNMLAVDAIKMMEENKITQVFVIENMETKKTIGLVHVHNILGGKFV